MAILYPYYVHAVDFLKTFSPNFIKLRHNIFKAIPNCKRLNQVTSDLSIKLNQVKLFYAHFTYYFLLLAFPFLCCHGKVYVIMHAVIHIMDFGILKSVSPSFIVKETVFIFLPE